MRTRTRTLLAALVVLVVVAGSCSDDDDAAPEDTAEQPGPSEATDTGVVQLVALDEGSPYVQELCTIDFFDPGDEEDPIGWVIGELRELPAANAAEAQEVAWMIERLQRSEKTDDPLETDDLTSVAAVLRARCS
jgi:hypothetical protein